VSGLLADSGHVHVLPKVYVSLPTQARELLCAALFPHQRTPSSPIRDTRILSQDLDQDLGRGSPASLAFLSAASSSINCRIFAFATDSNALAAGMVSPMSRNCVQ